MATKKDRERRKATFKNREEKHERGFQPQTFKIPKGMSLYQPKPGRHRIDIIPYVAGEGNPCADKGFEYFERTYFVHKAVGPEKQTVVCLRKTLKQPCPICEHRMQLSDDPEDNEELIKEPASKERQPWLVIDQDERDKGVQLWDMSYHLFGKGLDEKIREADEEDKERYENFADLEHGLTLRIVCTERSFGGRNFIEVTDIEFKGRKEQYPADMADDQPCLDLLLTPLSYNELKKIFLASPADSADAEDEDEEDEPKNSSKKPSSKRGPKSSGGSKVKDNDDDDEDEDEEELDEEEDEDESPPPRGKGSSKSGTKKPSSKDDDDEDEDEDEDEPAAKPSSKGGISIGAKVTFENDAGDDIVGEIVALNRSEKYCTVKDKKGKRHVDVDLDEVVLMDNDEEDEEEDAPKPKPKLKAGGKKAPAKVADNEEDEEDEEDEDEEEVPTSKRKAKKGDTVAWMKGSNRVTGKVLLINADSTAKVQPKGESKKITLKLADLKVMPYDDDEEEEDEDDDD